MPIQYSCLDPQSGSSQGDPCYVAIEDYRSLQLQLEEARRLVRYYEDLS